MLVKLNWCWLLLDFPIDNQILYFIVFRLIQGNIWTLNFTLIRSVRSWVRSYGYTFCIETSFHLSFGNIVLVHYVLSIDTENHYLWWSYQKQKKTYTINSSFNFTKMIYLSHGPLIYHLFCLQCSLTIFTTFSLLGFSVSSCMIIMML